jgi:hypothetical protein
MGGLWNATVIGNMRLGAVWKLLNTTGNYVQQVGYVNPVNCPLTFSVPLEIRNAGGIRMMPSQTTAFSSMWDIKPLAGGQIEVIQGNALRAAWFRPGSYWRGVSPYVSNYNSLGSPNYRWRAAYTQVFSTSIATKTADYTVDTQDASGASLSAGNRPFDHTILCDATSAAITITLPSVTDNRANEAAVNENTSVGRILVIKKIDSTGNTVTIDANSTQLIDGAETLVLSAQWQTVTLQCNGSAWYVIATN